MEICYRSKELADKVEELEAKVDELQESIGNKNNQISTTQTETRGLKAEMSAINKVSAIALIFDIGKRNIKNWIKLQYFFSF